jgi:glycosyltransferase involved in cell wall biosynthesis
MNNQLTIVIPCKNEGFGIINMLKLLRNQHIDCQIIVADSSTDTDTFNLLHNYRIHSPQLIKIIKGGLPAVARNNGAKFVKTPYILFLDADIYLKEDHVIRKCIRQMIEKDYDLVTCKFKTIEKKYNWIYRVFDVIQWVSSKTKPFAIGGFMLFKTETFNKLGGFNEEDKIAEDYHLSSKIKPRKFKIIDVHVHTPGRRFAKKGFYYMMKLAWSSWFNRNNDDWFKQDYNYWK